MRRARRLAALIGLIGIGAPAVAQQLPLPRAPQGFRVELVDEAPSLLWPSAVHCLSDGSLLVAEDPMDMPGPADRPIDRILLYRFAPDGTWTRTVFADALYAVFGMQEVDGAVYVVNMPHLTVLRDNDGDGVADERRELLTDLGPKAPGWPGGVNDHAVSGIRLGMDGWLYVSVGDKGIPRATGTDGSHLTLRGGGVIRLRPDGSRLEVVTRGTRNHLDVALDERDELFTFDNTDDGLGWWRRLTHQIETGDYGYPWDYRLAPERSLPAMAEYGAGAPTGGLVYRAGAWPEQYHGNLFFCEWAKGLVKRFDLAREGASFRVTLAEDFLVAREKVPFFPTDVCESPDGRFLYVSDWGIGTWKVSERTGRLYRVRRTGDFGAPGGVAPRLFRTVADGAVDGAPTPEPNFRARLLAQRALVRLDDLPESNGAGFARALELLDRTQPAAVRRHALWALEAMAFRSAEARPLALEAITNALLDDSADLRAEAARALGSRRMGGAAELVPLLRDPDPTVRRRAATALGRLGERAAVGSLVAALESEEEDVVLRGALRGALRRLDASDPVLARLPGRDGRTELDWKLVLRERYDLRLVEQLARLADANETPSPATRALAVELLSEVHRKPEPWDGVWWQTQPTRDGYPPKEGVWAGTPIALTAVRSALEDRAPLVQRAALRAVARMPDREALPSVRAAWFRAEEDETRLVVLDVLESLRDSGAAPLLADVLADADADLELELRAIEVASVIASPEMVRVLSSALRDPARRESQIVACLAALARLGRAPDGGADAAGLASLIETRLADEREAVRAEAARALAAVRGADASELLLVLFAEDPSAEVRGAAARALGSVDAREAVPVLIDALDDLEMRDDVVLALCDMPESSAVRAYLLGLGTRSREIRDRAADALRVVRIDVRNELEAMKLARKLPEKVLPQVQEIYSEPRPLAFWRVLGPIPEHESPSPAAGPVDVEQGLESLRGTLAPVGHETDHPQGLVDLKTVFGDRTGLVAYAAATVDSPIDRRARIAVGSDGPITLWVNGVEALRSDTDRTWLSGQDEVTVRLREGENSIVARIGRTTGDWTFSVAVSEAGVGPLFEAGLVQSFDARSYRALALAEPGNPRRGQRIFEDLLGAACIKCHAIDGSGGHSGPDLYDVGQRYRREDLITSVLDPSQRVATSYRASWFEFKDGKVVFGQVQREEDDRVWVVDVNGDPLEVDLGLVVDRGESPISLMPEGIPELMSARDFVDLIGFLETLRGQGARPSNDGQRR